MNRFCWLLACFFFINVSAQDKLVIMGKSPDTYVVYASNGTETLQSISNGLGLSVARLATYNNTNINATAVLAKGTQIKIPLTRDNLLQQPADNSAPVYHIIKKGENLYRLNQLYNKVPLASLREWNHMQKDIVKDGQLVIIGYMVNAKPPVATEKKPEPKKEIPAINTVVQAPAAEKKNTDKPVIPVATPAQKEVPVNQPVTKTNLPAEKKQPEVKKKEEPVSAEYIPKEGDEGYFASAYSEHTKDQTQQFRSGDAAIFKTISGWTDRKFYVLMNDVAPRTVVRITGPGNKSICAMVLGPLQETKGANGLLLRLSNSAASALGLADPKFTVTVTYFE